MVNRLMAPELSTAWHVGTQRRQIALLAALTILASFVSVWLVLRIHVGAVILLLALAVLVLGMGLPTTPSYIIAAAIGAPQLVSMGVDLLPAHLFIFYFAVLADATPPVAAAAFAAASQRAVSSRAASTSGGKSTSPHSSPLMSSVQTSLDCAR